MSDHAKAHALLRDLHRACAIEHAILRAKEFLRLLERIEAHGHDWVGDKA
jgi:hypothetical protein